MYVQRNIEARPCNHCCSAEVINNTCCECMCVALVTQHAMRMRHIGIYGMPRSTAFFHIISQTARFKRKKVAEYKMCVLISSTTFV